MTEMSTAGDATGAPPAAGGAGKADPVVPDTVVYVCSLVIVVMVVGGVIALSLLMKQRLEVNQNVSTGAPAPKRLFSVEDSGDNEFKILNDDDPFNYRVAKARDGFRRKVPFYEAAHSKQKAKKHKKKTTTRVPNRKKPAKKATRQPHKPRNLPPKQKKTPPRPRKAPPKPMKTPPKTGKISRKPTVRPPSRPAKAAPKQVKGKGHVAQHRELKSGTTAATAAAVATAAAIKEIGIKSNVSDVGVKGVEIKRNKPEVGAAVNKGGRNDSSSNDSTPKEKSFVQVSAKKLSPKEKKQKAIAETMKLLLGKGSNLLDAPDKVNLSDVSDFIATDNHSVSELASKEEEAENTTSKQLRPADPVGHGAGANNTAPEFDIRIKPLNLSVPVVPHGVSDNATAPSSVSQGNVSYGGNTSIASDLVIKDSQHNVSQGAVSPLNQSLGELRSPASPSGNTAAHGASSANESSFSKETPKRDLPAANGGSERTSVDKDSPPNAVPLGESDSRQSPNVSLPVKGEPTSQKSPADQPVDKSSNLAAGGASASAPNSTHPSDKTVDPSASNKLQDGVLSPAGEVAPGASAAKTSSANERAEKAPATNTSAASGSSAGAPADNSSPAKAVPADESAPNKSPDKEPAIGDLPTGRSGTGKSPAGESGDKVPAANVPPPASGVPASASADSAPAAKDVPADANKLPAGPSPVGEIPAGRSSAGESPVGAGGDKAPAANVPPPASGASASASADIAPAAKDVPANANKLPEGPSPVGDMPAGRSSAGESPVGAGGDKAPAANLPPHASGASASAFADSAPAAKDVPADANKLPEGPSPVGEMPAGRSSAGESPVGAGGEKAPAANVPPPASGASASAFADSAPVAKDVPADANKLPEGPSPVGEISAGRSSASVSPVGAGGDKAPSANVPPPASGASASASADRAPAAKGVPADANKAPEGPSPVGEIPAGRSAAGESPVGEGGHKAPAANLPPASGASAGASADSAPAARDLSAGSNKLPEGGPPVPAGSSAAGKSPASEVNDKAPAALPLPDSGASAGASASNASFSNLGQSAEKESARTNGVDNGAPMPVAPGSPGEVASKVDDIVSDSKGKGASAVRGPKTQRPLFCEVRKFITRPLASYCTHLLFGRLPLATLNGAVTVGEFDSSTQEQLRLMSKVRPSWPHVRLLTTLGGGGERDDAALARAFEAGDAAMDALATDAAHLVRSRGLDGLNVHWAVPDLEGDVDTQARGLVTFLTKLRKELGSSALITVVLPSEREERNAAFNVKAIQPLANYLFLSTHENFSPYSALTRFNGPAQDTETGGMFTAISDVIRELGPSNSRQLCFTFGLSGVSYKVDAGSALAKYVPLIGAGGDQANVRSAQDAARIAAQLPKEGRPVTYDEVCKLNLTCHRAYVEKSCYDKVGDTWYGYVDEEAVASKAKWLLKDGWENLCVVAWNVDSDDTKGSCRSNAAAPYPLLRTLSQATAELSY